MKVKKTNVKAGCGGSWSHPGANTGSNAGSGSAGQSGGSATGTGF